jgi:copper(I)-binding protein
VIRSSHRTAGRRLLVLAIAALVPVLAGCEAGNNAPTQEWHQPTDGTGLVHDNIAIRNVFVLGAPIGSTIGVGHSAVVFLALINNGAADKLVKLTAPGTAKSVTIPGGGVSVASQQSVLLTVPAPRVILRSLTRPLTGGSSVRLVLTFRNAATVGMTVPVMPRAQYYSTFSPAPSPSSSPKAAKGKPAVKPSPTPTT